MKVKNESEVVQSYPTLSDSMDCSLPGSSIHEIFQARVLEWGAIAFSDTLLAGSRSPKIGFCLIHSMTSLNLLMQTDCSQILKSNF